MLPMPPPEEDGVRPNARRVESIWSSSRRTLFCISSIMTVELADADRNCASSTRNCSTCRRSTSVSLVHPATMALRATTTTPNWTTFLPTAYLALIHWPILCHPQIPSKKPHQAAIAFGPQGCYTCGPAEGLL